MLIQIINRNISIFPDNFIKIFDIAQANPAQTTKTKPMKLVVLYISAAGRAILPRATATPVFCQAVGGSCNNMPDRNSVKIT